MKMSLTPSPQGKQHRWNTPAMLCSACYTCQELHWLLHGAISARPATAFGVLFPFYRNLKFVTFPRPQDCSEEELYSTHRSAVCFCRGLGKQHISPSPSAHWSLPLGSKPGAPSCSVPILVCLLLRQWATPYPCSFLPHPLMSF